MKRLNVKRSKNIEEIIDLCYRTDKEVLDKYHVLAPTTFEEAKKHTIWTLNMGSNMVINELSIDNELVGYFGEEHVDTGLTYLTGFFILPKFRTKEVIKKFWKIVQSKFGKTIFTYLYEKNSRAIKFVERRGFILVNTMYVDREQQNVNLYRLN